MVRIFHRVRGYKIYEFTIIQAFISAIILRVFLLVYVNIGRLILKFYLIQISFRGSRIFRKIAILVYFKVFRSLLCSARLSITLDIILLVGIVTRRLRLLVYLISTYKSKGTVLATMAILA